MYCMAHLPTHPKLATLIRRSPKSRTSQKLAVQPVQNAPSRPPFSPFSSASSRWLPALSSLFAAPTIAQRWPPLLPRWFNLISPHTIRPLALWVTGLFGDNLGKSNQCSSSLISFDVVSVPHGRYFTAQCTTVREYTTGSSTVP